MLAQRVERLGKTDKIYRHQLRPLMQQLVKSMLAIGTRLTPDDLPRGVIHGLAAARHGLTVTLHISLLQIRRQSVQILLVGQNGRRLAAIEIAVPDAEQRQNDRQILLQRRCPEMLVHGVKTCQHFVKTFWADGYHDAQPDGAG